ncbi:MAG: hypothetical protein J5556_07125 [Deltaproteobacteria bacterium]|nr:hypothetical protein [Deltaproteobacteria bacterium]
MKLWKIRGTLSEMDYGQSTAVVRDLEGRPYLLTVYGTMRRYLEEIGDSDAEEKYMAKDFLYTPWCELIGALIPGSVERVPAKAVAALDMAMQELQVYGPREILTEENPPSMAAEEWARFKLALAENGWNL